MILDRLGARKAAASACQCIISHARMPSDELRARSDADADDRAVKSQLDTDIYTWSMQRAILHHYPHAQARYLFNNRSQHLRFNRAAYERIRQSVDELADLALQPDEREWVVQSFRYFEASYVEYLSNFRFKPSEQIDLSFNEAEGQIELEVHGNWAECVLYTTPIMYIVSEAYFRHVDTDWDYTGQIAKARDKAKRMIGAGATISEWGTRRRRSYKTQLLVTQGLVEGAKEARANGAKGDLAGPGANALMARLFDQEMVQGLGFAHEWISGVAAIEGAEHANEIAMRKWEEANPEYAYPLILADTFTAERCFKELARHPDGLRKWTGFRHDSGSPEQFTKRVAELYRQHGVDPADKLLVYSDSLSTEKVLELLPIAREHGLKPFFGIGTHLTNDFVRTATPDRTGDGRTGQGEPQHGQKSEALNIVIKLRSLDGKPCIKLSDEPGKYAGDPAEVERVRELIGV